MAEGKKPSQGLAIAALLINLLVLPGVGTIIGGRTKTGVWQIVLFGVGIPLTIVLIGIPMIIAAWIWALVSSIQLIQESHA